MEATTTEDQLLNNYFAANNAVEVYNREVRTKKQDLDLAFNEAESAILNYMRENGLSKFSALDNHTVSLGISTSTEITCAVDELPERFIRIKKEPNKILINEAVKAGEQFNWITYKTTEKLSVR